MDWRGYLKHDPIPALLGAKSVAVRYFVSRDLIGSDVGPASELWQLPSMRRIIEAQRQDGSWGYHGGRERVRSAEDYN